jgi:uncharacterized protein YbaR (Trm112 family)
MGFIRYSGLLKSDLVLDVGSGSGPHPRADILCDKYEKGNSERPGYARFLRQRVFIAAEGENLPFKNKSFDYAICSHVVEHSENPEHVLKELMRVASRGYIETPTEIYEALFGWPFHKWYVRLEGSILVFKRKKNCNNLEGLLNPYFLRDFNFAAFYVQNRDLFNIRYHWNKDINYKIIDQNEDFDTDKGPGVFVKKYFENRPRGILSFIKNLPEIMSYFLSDNLKYKIFDMIYCNEFKKNKKIDLNAVLACPRCKNSIILDEWAVCSNCRLRYPVKDGIMYMKISDGVPMV